MKEEQREEEKKKKVEQKMAQIEEKNEVCLCSYFVSTSAPGSSDDSGLILPTAPGGGEGEEKSGCQASRGAGAEEEDGRRGQKEKTSRLALSSPLL